MNKKRIAIVLGIVLLSVIAVLLLTVFIKPENNIFAELLDGVVNIQTNAKPFCEHSGGGTPEKPGSCAAKDIGTVSDFCTENVLHKTYCLNDECHLKRYDCEEYCQGICLTAAGRGYCACPAQ